MLKMLMYNHCVRYEVLLQYKYIRILIHNFSLICAAKLNVNADINYNITSIITELKSTRDLSYIQYIHYIQVSLLKVVC